MTGNRAEETRVFDQFGQTDEFDRPEDGPIGLHRGKRALAARLLPYLITIVLAVALGLATWLWRSGTLGAMSDKSASSTSQTSSGTASKKAATGSQAKAGDAAKSQDSAKDSAKDSSAQQGSTTSTKDGATGTDDSASSADQTAAADLTKSVVVYNATSVNGLAATKVSVLKAAGYTTASARNPVSKDQSPVSVVWYKTAADEATAKAVAAKLAITTIQQASAISSDVAVYLK